MLSSRPPGAITLSTAPPQHTNEEAHAGAKDATISEIGPPLKYTRKTSRRGKSVPTQWWIGRAALPRQNAASESNRDVPLHESTPQNFNANATQQDASRNTRYKQSTPAARFFWNRRQARCRAKNVGAPLILHGEVPAAWCRQSPRPQN